MDGSREEYFGSPDQQALQRRALAMHRLLRDDPRFHCHGRSVGVSRSEDDGPALQAALTRLQGACACEAVPGEALAAHVAALEDQGLKTDQFEEWTGGGGVFDAARAVLAARSLPEDLEIVTVGSDTAAGDMQALADLTASCGVLLPMGAFMRGEAAPAICLYARDAEGRPVASAAAVMQFHRNHPRGSEAWWGMLATRDDRRGEGIALMLGAAALIAARERLGCAGVFTGIRAGNAPSAALCGKLGLAHEGRFAVIAIDPGMFGAERMTK